MSVQNSRLNLSNHYRLQWEKTQEKYVLLYAEGMIELNDSAAEILILCDGKHTANDIISALETKFTEDDISGDVYQFLDDAVTKGWIEYS